MHTTPARKKLQYPLCCGPVPAHGCPMQGGVPILLPHRVLPHQSQHQALAPPATRSV